MSKRQGTTAWGGFLPAVPDGASGSDVWPPRGESFDSDFLTVLKRIDAFISRGKLVWLRDYDEVQTLTVARKGRDGLFAPRFWPAFRIMKLNDDGSTTPNGNEADYVRHWVSADETEKVFMAMQNSDTYTTTMKQS